MSEIPSPYPWQSHVESCLADPETINALDMSYLATVMPAWAYHDFFKKIAKTFLEKTGTPFRTELIFSITDENIKDKRGFLRYLKGLMESDMRPYIASIVVKGPQGTTDIEPNVFASNVHFEEII